MFENIITTLIFSEIEVDGINYDDIKINDINNKLYLDNNTFSLYNLMEAEILKRFSDASDISLNAKTTFSFIKPIKFKSLDISFKASTYTAIELEFIDGDRLKLQGEEGDYNKYDYSFNKLKNRKPIKKIICYGSYGSEEFISLTLK